MAKEPPKVTEVQLLSSCWIDGECYRVEGGEGGKAVLLSVGKGKDISEKDAKILIAEGRALVTKISGGEEPATVSTRSAAALKKGGKGGSEE